MGYLLLIIWLLSQKQEDGLVFDCAERSGIDSQVKQEFSVVWSVVPGIWYNGLISASVKCGCTTVHLYIQA